MENILPHLISILLGTVVGIVSGLLPGFGNLLGMMLLFPFIMHWAPVDVFLCYAALAQLSQFVGSLTALYTGIAGETSSMPVVIESKRLDRLQFPDTLAATAVGSAAAGILATLFCLMLIPVLFNMAWVYRTEVAVVLLLLTVVLVTVSNPQQSKLSSALLLILGILLGMVGWNTTFSTGLMTFGITELYQGIPISLVLIFLFAVPQLMQIKDQLMDYRPMVIHLRWPKIKWLSVVGNSIIGFVGGLVPGMTTVLSSQLSYAITSRRTLDPHERIVASETANNSGAISQLIPMLVIGLPLIASEALTLAMMENKGFVATPGNAIDILLTAAPVFVLLSIVGLIVAWPLAGRVLEILRVNGKWFRTSLLGILLTTVYIQAYNDYMLSFYLAVSLALLPVLWLVYRYNTTPLIFGYLISDQIWDHSVRLVALYLI